MSSKIVEKLLFYVIIFSHSPNSSGMANVHHTTSYSPLSCHARDLQLLCTPLARQHNVGIDHEVKLIPNMPGTYLDQLAGKLGQDSATSV